MHESINHNEAIHHNENTTQNESVYKHEDITQNDINDNRKYETKNTKLRSIRSNILKTIRMRIIIIPL